MNEHTNRKKKKLYIPVDIKSSKSSIFSGGRFKDNAFVTYYESIILPPDLPKATDDKFALSSSIACGVLDFRLPGVLPQS